MPRDGFPQLFSWKEGSAWRGNEEMGQYCAMVIVF